MTGLHLRARARTALHLRVLRLHLRAPSARMGAAWGRLRVPRNAIVKA